MTKRLLLALVTGSFLIIFSSIIVESKAGCCSHHGGVCGCKCCDGTPLSAKCAPYYPGCGYDAPEQPQEVPTKPPYKQPSYTTPSYKLPSGVEEIVREHLPYGYPSKKNILYRVGYVASFDVDKDVADWVCYHLTAAYLKGTVERTDDYRPDPDIRGGPELSDYKGSGFDRSHFAPAADMKRSRRTMSESFLLTNMSPQRPGFNRGIWNKLEEKVREFAVNCGDINVCTGPIYLDDDRDGYMEYDEIGGNDVAVPDAFYKIIVSEQGGKIYTIAFALRNEKYPSGTSLFENTFSIDDIESFTGLDFLELLPDSIEKMIEATKSKTICK